MTLRVVLTPYGRPALATLRELIDAAKGDDPFQPVTVVARGKVGLSVRRALATGASPGGRVGITNVTFTTLSNLAGSVATAPLAERGQLPVTDAVLRAAVRNAVAVASGPVLAPTSEHAATVDAVVATYRDLRTVPDDLLSELARGGRQSAEVIDVVREVRRQLADWFDEVDLLEEARAQVAAGLPLTQRTGPVLLYLPQSLERPSIGLVRAMAQQVPVTVLLGVTGDEEADAMVRDMVAALVPEESPAWPRGVTVASGVKVVSAPSSDAEVLVVLRQAMQHMEDGTALERIALVHSGSTIYGLQLHNQLQESGIPFNGTNVRTLASTVAGRMLLGALQLGDHNWRHDEVVGWLATGPLSHQGRQIPAARWDVLSAQAGILQGLSEWQHKLAALAGSLRDEAGAAAERDDGSEALQDSQLADARRCDELSGFLTDVDELLSQSPSQWSAWAEWATGLLDHLAGGAMAIEAWPADEFAAATEVKEAIHGLTVLDRMQAPCTPALAKAALVAELDRPSPQTTRFGTGVLVASLGELVGLDVDVVFMMGLNDGAFPARPVDDVLIPDRQRQDVGEGVPLRSARAAAQRRDYLAVLGSAASVLSFPRGNQRDGRELRPSRWLLDTLGEVTGSSRRLYAGDLDTVPECADYQVIRSFLHAVATDDAPVDLHDRDLRSLLAWTRADRSVADHFLCHTEAQLGRGIDARRSQRQGFTRFNGNLGQVAAVDLVPDITSATRLEGFAACPRRYFFESVLRVAPRPETSRVLSTAQVDKGTLVHAILEDYVGQALDEVPTNGSDDPFSLARLMDVANAKLRDFEAQGLCGPPAAWRVEQILIRRELRAYWALDRSWRLEHGARTVQVEHSFGFPSEGGPPVTVDRPQGIPVRFRGRIDRVDRTSDGSTVVVDYKTGSLKRFAGVDEDHYAGGRHLQLGVYGLAVASGTGPVRSEYAFVSEPAGYCRIGHDVGAAEIGSLEGIVDTLATTMEQGSFPAQPGTATSNDIDPCAYCPYDSVCPPDRHDVWERVRQDPVLVRFVELVDPEIDPA